MARIQQKTRILDPAPDRVPHETRLIVIKATIVELCEAPSSRLTTLTQDKSSKNRSIQRKRSSTSVDTENGTIKRRHAPTLEWTGNTPMVVRTWWTDGNLMTMVMQRTCISPMTVGAQYTGNDLGIGIARSRQQESTQMQ